MHGRAALITGAGSGIGQGLALALARRGVSVTLADVDLAAVERLAAELRASGSQALAVRCDVSDPAQHMAAFRAHMECWGRLDYALLNAGIGERGNLIAGRSNGWQQTLDIDLRAVMEGCRLAARSMLAGSPEGAVPSRATGSSSSGAGSGSPTDAPCIMITASAGGTFPMPLSPVYAASKAACIQLTRSLAGPLAQRGIRICALCPQARLMLWPLLCVFRSQAAAGFACD